MKKTFKFYFCNRVLAMFYVWAAILCYCAFISTNVYLNEAAIYIGGLCVVTAFACYDGCATPNAQERLFMRKLNKIFA